MLNHLGFVFVFCFFFLRLGLGQRRAVVIIGRWLLPSLVDTGDICCHYWQHILVTLMSWYQITGNSAVCSTIVQSNITPKKTSKARITGYLWGIHRWQGMGNPPVTGDSPNKWPVMRFRVLSSSWQGIYSTGIVHNMIWKYRSIRNKISSHRYHYSIASYVTRKNLSLIVSTMISYKSGATICKHFWNVPEGIKHTNNFRYV